MAINETNIRIFGNNEEQRSNENDGSNVVQTDRKHFTDLFIRTGYSDAKIAFEQVQKGKADGDRGILWIRAEFQDHFLDFGRFIDSHAGKVLFVGLLTIATFCVGLKSATFHSTVEELWMTDGIDIETITNYASVPKKLIDSLSSHQMIIQTPRNDGSDILSTKSLFNHLAVIQKASQVTINLFDVTWKLKDVCQSPSVPIFEQYYIEQAMDKIMPCSIITPLDCFWEGAKLLGPDYPVKIPTFSHTVNWTSLNPMQLIESFKTTMPEYSYQMLEDFLRQSGITSGYQEKPCLNPLDPHCPKTSPNRKSRRIPDIGAELTGGCYGISAKYMHWPEELLVGEIKRNKTGHIKNAKALQAIIQLMNANELYDLTFETWKVKHLGNGWNVEKSALVLKTWQKAFAEEIKKLSQMDNDFEFVTYSTSNLNGVLEKSIKIDYFKWGVCLILNVLYSWYIYSGLAVCGVLLIISSTTAGLGLCSLMGYSINILTINVLPFLCIGLALRDINLLLNTLSRCNKTELAMKRCAMQILITSAIAVVILLLASLFPVTGLKVFTFECAIVICFNTAAVLIVFPALITLDIRYEEITSNCASVSTPGTTNTAIPHFTSIELSDKLPPSYLLIQQSGRSNYLNTSNYAYKNYNLNAMDNLSTRQKDSQKNLIKPKKKNINNEINKGRFFDNFINKIFIPFMLSTIMKSIICIIYFILVVTLAMHVFKIDYDMTLSSFIPRNTQEFEFVELQHKYFGFYNFYIATHELEYPYNQKLLHDYHQKFTKVNNIIKDSNGGLQLNDFWLSNFRSYLIDLQKEFDENYRKNYLNTERWFRNATERGVLAFKLLSQTGIVEYPVDKGQILEMKLVQDGIINPKAFYNYFTIWNSNDQIGASSSQANFHPRPFEYFTSKDELDLKIPKSRPLSYAQMPFYLKNLKSTSQTLATLNEIYKICDYFNDKGVKSNPVGLIFSFFEPFRFLHYLIMVQIVLMSFIVAFFTSLMIKWSKVWYILISIIISMLILIPLNINSLTVIFIAIHWIIVGRNLCLILMGFVCSIGNKERRIKLSLELNSETIIKGDIAILFSTIIMITSDYNFIQKQFFSAIIVIVSASLVNSLIFFPVFLSIFGPNAEIIPFKYIDRIATPSPEMTPIIPRHQPKPPKRILITKATREPSLTTITEESFNQSYIVQPEVTVEYSNNSNNSNNSQSIATATASSTQIEPENKTMTSSSTNKPFTTKVTTNIKVEILHES